MKRKILLCITLAALILVAFAFPAFAEIIAPEEDEEKVPSVPVHWDQLGFYRHGLGQAACGNGSVPTGGCAIRNICITGLHQTRNGKLSLPSVPISDFQLVTKDRDDDLTGAVKVHLYPADKTEILNQPENVVETIDLTRARNAALVTGNTAPKTSKGPLVPDNVEVYTYEVNVNQKAPAVDFATLRGPGRRKNLHDRRGRRRIARTDAGADFYNGTNAYCGNRLRPPRPSPRSSLRPSPRSSRRPRPRSSRRPRPRSSRRPRRQRPLPLRRNVSI